MPDQQSLETWLTLVNARYRQEEIPPGNRPWRALSDFSKEFKCSVLLDSPISTSIFDWFAANSKPGSQAVGSLFTGSFYFDACFWPLKIPMAWGTVALNPLDYLEAMPQTLKDQIMTSNNDYLSLNLYWMNCCDYAYGIDEILKIKNISSTALTFIENGNRELIGAIAQLLIPHPNTKAILALRMASEIFMKALLIQENNLTDQQLKKNFSHKIEDIANKCFLITRSIDFQTVSKNVNIFPDVSDRYHGNESPLSDVWKAVCVTQIAVTAVTRWYSNRDMRSQFSIYS
jgi:hypothetical protein